MANRVTKDAGVLGIMAIENTIAGSILQNYQIIRESDLVIVGEYKLRIEHSLVALPGVDLHQIKEVNSHPMALMQCTEFLDTLPNVKLVEKDDTAGSAKWIKENNLADHAAICPSGAAELYGMRFLVLANRSVAKETLAELSSREGDGAAINKSSMVFTLPHSSGSLSKVLTILSFYDMNLSMIQSLPIVGKEWEYQFYINLLFDDYQRYKLAIDAILPLCREFKILGEYAEGKQTV